MHTRIQIEMDTQIQIEILIRLQIKQIQIQTQIQTQIQNVEKIITFPCRWQSGPGKRWRQARRRKTG